jgi:DNA invertase Pin-like site-specific DNA recombinase
MLVDELNQKGILFKSLSQSLIDTTTETGEFVFKLFALLAEHERKRLIRRTKARQEATRARGRMGERPKGLSPRSPLSGNCSDGDKCLQRAKKYQRYYEGIFNSFNNNSL